MTADTSDTDVVIVGAGPSGLLLAGDLAEAGVRTTVLERRAGISGATRAFALHARTLEALDARGLADEVVATGRPTAGFAFFGGLGLDLSGLPSRFPYVLVTPQYNTERALLRRAEAAGTRIVRGCRVTGLRQDAGGVEVAADGRKLRAGWAVGADGVRSTVRGALGLDFPGGTVVESLMLADVRLREAPGATLTVNGTGDSFAFVAPFGDGWFRVITWNRRNPLPDTAPVDLEEMRAVARDALGSDFGMRDARWTSRIHCDERQVRSYRVGRAFLVGDAAHVHTPAGGQGMNAGLQDAANLGWKLAAAVRGHAPDGLLDTYHTERHPVGRTVVRASGGLIRAAMVRSAAGQAVRDAVGGAALRVGPCARRVAGVLSGIGVRYPAGPGAHPLAGRRAPDLPLAGAGRGPGRLYEALRDGCFVLLAPAGGGVRPPAGWTDRVRAATAGDAEVATRLVRPDGYVGWAACDPDPAALSAALTAWCGPRAA